MSLLKLKAGLKDFLTDWTVHGSDLKAGFELPYKRFIVIGLDQSMNAASGCSIDSSVHYIQSLEKKYDIDLLDKMNVSYKQGEFVAYKTLIDLKRWLNKKLFQRKPLFLTILSPQRANMKNFGKYLQPKLALSIYVSLP